jgi:hypothetical protein
MNPYTRIKDLEDRVYELEQLGHKLLHDTEDLHLKFDSVLKVTRKAIKTFVLETKKPGRPRKQK